MKPTNHMCDNCYNELVKSGFSKNADSNTWCYHKWYEIKKSSSNIVNETAKYSKQKF